jgi:molecular chaperone DnaJ
VCQGSGQTARNLGGFAFAEPCQSCMGRGVLIDDPCPTCHGAGEAPSTRTIQARIPAGVKDGQRIRLKGKGAPGTRGGPAGDLFVEVHVQPHPVFGRRGDHDVTLTVPVTFPEAVLGAEVVVPALDGSTVTVRIPPGTSNGRTLRLRGKGGAKRDGSRGDLLVTVEVAVPQRIDAQASQALRAYAEATNGDDPRVGLIEQARKE